MEMDPNFQTYRLRMKHLENALADHQDKFNRFDKRNDAQSAQIRSLERQLYDLKYENNRLNEQVETLRSTDNQPDTYRSGEYTDRSNRDYHRNRDATPNPGSVPNDSRFISSNLQIQYPELTKDTPVYMLIRTKRDLFEDLKKSFQRNFWTLKHSRAHLKGFVYSDSIKVNCHDTGHCSWHLSKVLPGAKEYACSNVMAMLTFTTADEADTWIKRHPDFKDPHFPAPDGAEILLLQENRTIGESPFTIVMMEYPNVADQNYLKTHVMEPMHQILLENYKESCKPFVIYVVHTGKQYQGAPLQAPRYWYLARNKTIVAHCFYREEEAMRFCNDERINGLRSRASSVAGHETIVQFTVENLRPDRKDFNLKR